MRGITKRKVIAAISTFVLISVANAQDELPERIHVDSKVPAPAKQSFGAIEARSDEPDISAIEEEIQIMAKVLEESIDNAGIGDWKPMNIARFPTFDGAFGQFGHIHTRYIPTVGVIFTVPVGFPLRSTAKYSEDEDHAEPDAADLWKKHQRSSAKYNVRFNKMSATTDDDGNVRIISSEPFVIRETEISKSNQGKTSTAVAIAGPNGEVSFGGVGVGGGGGGGGGGVSRGGLGFGGVSGGIGSARIAVVQQEYDEEKVAALRQTLIETVAEYGHRIEHLPADERVFVIAESSEHGFPGGIVPTLGYLYKGSASTSAPSGTSSARYQISVEKKALLPGATAKSIEPAIVETKY